MKMSFYDWCIENNRKDLLDRWDYNLNKKSPKDLSFNTRIKSYFKCPCGKHDSTGTFLSMREKTGNYDIICKGCNSFGQWGIDNICDDFLEKYWDYDKNSEDPMALAKKSNKVVYIKCQNKDYHGSYSVVPCDFVDKNIRCPYCHMMKIHKLDSLGYVYPKSFDVWSSKNEDTPFDISPKSKQKRWFMCENKIHDDYLSYVYRANNRNFECPKCHQESSDSYLQKKVDEYILSEYNYPYYKEYDCSVECINPNTGYILPYDRELVINDTRLFIEVNGKQHYKICLHTKKDAEERGISVEEAFELQKYRDNLKKNYVLRHGYHFLEIPYNTSDNDTYKSIIDNKISEILSLTTQN